MAEPMLTVSAKEFASRLGYYQDEAMHRPVGVQRHGTTRAVMISLREYERLKRRDREVIRTEDLDDETLAAILNAPVPDEARRLNHLMEDAGDDGRSELRVPVGARGGRGA